MSGEGEQLNNPNDKFKFFKTKKFWAIILSVIIIVAVGYAFSRGGKLNEERGAQDTQGNNETSPNGGEGEDNNGNDSETVSYSEKEKKLLSDITFEKIKNENATANNAWKTYTSHDFDFQIDYPAAVSGNEFEVYDFKEIEYGGKHYMMNIEQMFITVFPTETYEFIDVKQSECYDPDDEESCSARHRVSCGSGKCTEIPNINKNVENYDAVFYSQKINRCYADPSGGTICPEPEYESNILIVKRGENYYKIKQPIFSPTILIEGEKEAYEAMLKSFRFIE